MKKHIEIVTFEEQAVKVSVKIDYDKREISLVDQNFTDKKWIFAGRGLQYMQGWKDILKSMEYSIDKATALLQAENDRKNDEIINNITKV